MAVDIDIVVVVIDRAEYQGGGSITRGTRRLGWLYSARLEGSREVIATNTSLSTLKSVLRRTRGATTFIESWKV